MVLELLKLLLFITINLSAVSFLLLFTFFHLWRDVHLENMKTMHSGFLRLWISFFLFLFFFFFFFFFFVVDMLVRAR